MVSYRFIGPDQPGQFQDCLALAIGINDFFVSITEQFTPLVQYPVRHTIVPPSLLVSEFEVLRDLNNLSSNKAPGPDAISNQIFKVFAPELAPVICVIYNQSLQESFVPGSLKTVDRNTSTQDFPAIHEAIDRGNNCVRIFFSDFSKGFDLIDHQILVEELSLLGVDPVLFSWIRSFLTNSSRAHRECFIGMEAYPWRYTPSDQDRCHPFLSHDK